MKKLFLYGILTLLAIVVAAFIFLGEYTDRVVDPYVRSLLEVTKPMGHQIEYKEIRVNLFQRYIKIKKVRMFPDTSVTKDEPKLKIDVQDIRLTGFSVSQMLFNKTLRIEEFLIENPEVSLTLPDSTHKVVKGVRKQKSQKDGSYLLTQISLEKILLSSGSFQLIRNEKILAKSPGINLIAQSISLVKNGNEEPIGFTYGDINLNLADIELRPETGLYDMKLAEFSYAKSDSTFVLDGFSMIPKYDKKEFSNKLDFQNDRFDVDIGHIKIGQVGIERFLENGPLQINSIIIDSINADIYRDKNVTFNFERFPLFYNESFLKINVPVFIDTVLITNSKVEYGELAEGREVAGSVVLEDFSLQLYDLTNQVTDDKIENVMQVNIQGRLMGEGPINIELALPLEGNLHDFKCSGSVGAMRLSPLNDFLEPAINMKLNEGKLNWMTFSFTANDDISNGWMEFLYQDLDVVILKKDRNKDWGFISNLANSMVLGRNPPPGKELKIVKILYERNKNKGIINYIWKTIQSGLLHTILPIKKYQIDRNKNTKEHGQKKGNGKKGAKKKK